MPPTIAFMALLKFDTAVMATVRHKLRIPPDVLKPPQLRQLRLPIRLGGLGFRALVEISGLAYFSCVAASLPFIKQTLTPLLAKRGVSGDAGVAAEFAKTDTAKRITSLHQHLLEHNSCGGLPAEVFPKEATDFWRTYSVKSAPHLQRLFTAKHESAVAKELMRDDKTLAIRVVSCTSKHASRWLTTFPRTPHHQLPDSAYAIAVRSRLGAPLFDHVPDQCICQKDVNEQKSPGHLLVCEKLKGVPLTHRHNIVVHAFCNAAMLAGVTTRIEVTESMHDAGDDDEKEYEPDVRLSGVQGELLVDITVVNPVRPSQLAQRSDSAAVKNAEKDEPKLYAIAQAEREKKRKYTPLANSLDVQFEPFACDVFGAMGKRAHKLVKWLVREAGLNGRFSNKDDRREFADTVHSWLSVAIQRAVAVSAADGLQRIRRSLRRVL